MKKIIGIFLLGAASSAYAVDLQFQAPDDSSGFEVRSVAGVDLDIASDTYTFQAGTFTAGWSDELSLDLWEDFFVNQLVTGTDTTATWVVNPAPFVTFDFQLAGAPAASVNGSQITIFGKNADGSEVFFVTNPSWLFPDGSQPSPTPASFKLNDNGTVAVGSTNVGATILNASTFQFVAAEAVPEPSTYLLMGLGLAGIFAVSRRKTTAK